MGCSTTKIFFKENNIEYLSKYYHLSKKEKELLLKCEENEFLIQLTYEIGVIAKTNLSKTEKDLVDTLN